MNRTCPHPQLHSLIEGQLEGEKEKSVIAHIESCEQCQNQLEQLSADSSWWDRARLNLIEAETNDDRYLLNLEIQSLFDPLSDSGEANWSAISIENSTLDSKRAIDEFEIQGKIGEGAMGIVYRGFDQSLNRPVAIKVMKSHLSSNDVARQRFEREAKAAAAVVHPNVVPIYRVNTSDKRRPYIVMALADGLSLQSQVLKHGPMDVKDVIRIGIQIASGLAEAHKQGLIHRDIKPTNVLFEKDVARIVITDFGLARAANDALITQTGCLTGTPCYMSPEQIKGAGIDARSDLFSVGSLLYFIATGREAFGSDGIYAVLNKVANETPKEPRHINVDIPESLNGIIMKLLEKEPANRIQSSAVLEQHLAKILAEQQQPKLRFEKTAATDEPQVQDRKRLAFIATFGLLGATGLLLLSGAFGFLSPPKTSTADRIESKNRSFTGDDQKPTSGFQETAPNSNTSLTKPAKAAAPNSTSDSETEKKPESESRVGTDVYLSEQEEATGPESAANDPRLAKLTELVMNGLSSSAILQANLRLNELESYLKLEEGLTEEYRNLVRRRIGDNAKGTRQRVTNRLRGAWDKKLFAQVTSVKINGNVYSLIDDSKPVAAATPDSQIQVVADLIDNQVVLSYGGGRMPFSLGQTANRVERVRMTEDDPAREGIREQLTIWESSSNPADADSVAQFHSYEAARTKKNTIEGVVAILASKLHLDEVQQTKMSELVGRSTNPARGTIKTIHQAYSFNKRLFELEPDFLTETQLAKWRLLKLTKNIAWD